MNKIEIYNFGPVNNAVIDLDKNMQVLIGAQASGKSTICKMIYFCQKIRDYTLEFLMDDERYADVHRNEYFNLYLKYLTGQFMGCFGKTTHMKRFNIKYSFGYREINIMLNKDGYIRFRFDNDLADNLNDLIDQASSIFSDKLNYHEINSVLDNITAKAMAKMEFRKRLYKLFENDAEIMYIPAGRSLLATLSEQLQDLSVSDMDLTMREFVNLIRTTKSRFGNKIPELVKDYTKTVKGQINNMSLDMAYRSIKNIFKADYTSEDDGEKIYFDEKHWVKLMYASSGQQEVLWILMLAFIIILEKRKSFVIIEEPEAHLFPEAQKDVVELISLMINSTESKAVITTHSPYILTSLNILLYSDKVENSGSVKGETVIPKSMRIRYDSFAAYKLENSENTMEDLLDAESHMIDTDYIDRVSSVTNDALERLLDKEFNR